MRRGKAAEWAAKNPILGDGEPGYETDSRKLKIGDGLSYWNNLPYVVGGEIDGSLIADGTVTVAKLGGDVDAAYAEASHQHTVSDITDFPSPAVPTSASDPGTAGTVLADADYLYVCVATDTWQRVSLLTVGLATW